MSPACMANDPVQSLSSSSAAADCGTCGLTRRARFTGAACALDVLPLPRPSKAAASAFGSMPRLAERKASAVADCYEPFISKAMLAAATTPAVHLAQAYPSSMKEMSCENSSSRLRPGSICHWS